MSFRLRLSLLSALAVGLGLTAPLPAPLAANPLDSTVQARVLDGGRSAQGGYLAALHLVLPEGWKTYWRAPGDAGIPPSFDWRGSQNLGEVTLRWPTPVVFDQNGYRSIGYQDELVLPLDITPVRADAPVRVKLTMEIGLCKEVCIPGEVRFDHELDTAAGRHPAIAAALAAQPFSAAEAGVRGVTCSLRPNAGRLTLEARIQMPPAGGAEVTVIEPGNPQIWVSETRSRRDGGTLIATTDLNLPAGAAGLDRSALRFTVLGRDRSVEIQGCVAG